MAKTRNWIFLGAVSLAAAVTVMASGLLTQVRAEVVDRIVAVVNEDIITLSKLRKATAIYRKNIEASQNSEARKGEMIFQLEQSMLKQLVEKSLTMQEAKRFGIQVTDKDVDAAIENVKTEKRLDDESLKQGLAVEGMTLEDYREQMKEKITQSMLIGRTVRSKVVITDTDVRTYYDANPDRFAGVQKYRLKNIIAENESAIREVESKLKQKSTSFSDLAKNYSVGSNAMQGGDLGVFDIANVSEEIRQALSGLGKGQYTEALPAGGAFQIIYVDDIIVEGRKSVDEAKSEIQNILFRERAQEQFKTWLESLKKSAHIELML